MPDTATVLVFGAILRVVAGLLQLRLWRQDRDASELGIWGGAHVLGGVGLVLVAIRTVLPPWLSIIAGNAVLLAGCGGRWWGVRRFEGRSAPLAAILAGAALWSGACMVPRFYHSLPDRAAAVAAIVASYAILCGWQFLLPHAAGRLPSRPALALLFGIEAAASLVRVAVALIWGFNEPIIDVPPSLWFGWPVTISIAMTVGTALLEIAVAKEAAEHRSNSVLAKARDAADRANLAKSRFLARMSHELRTPLNGVLGMAQSLTRDPALRGVHRERAVMMERSGRHLLAIINDILEGASVESGQFQLSPHPTRVAEIVQGCVDLVTETAAAKAIALEVRQESDAPEAVLADAVRLRQILLNLLGNAIKFTPHGGRVALHVARLTSAGGLRLAVTDTGPGVPAEFRPHLFRDFAQRPVDSGAMESTGLGLAISASLAAAMGGAIAYEAAPDGNGSRFIASLPLPVAESPIRPPAAMPPSRPATGVRVLVVDDIDTNRRLAELLLRQAGYTVVLAEDGQAALAALQRGPLPDVVLMDVYMPGLDGIVTTRGIRALPGRAGTLPVIAVTADATADRAQQCLAAGMNAVVTKPIDFDELADAIAGVLPAPAGDPTRADAALLPSEPATPPA